MIVCFNVDLIPYICFERVVRMRAEIKTRNLPNTKQEFVAFDKDFRFLWIKCLNSLFRLHSI